MLSLIWLAPVQAETGAKGPLVIIGQRDTKSIRSSDSQIFTARVDLGLANDICAAFEDSEEMLRVHIEQRAIGTDRIRIEPNVLLGTVRNRRAIISPPLLV